MRYATLLIILALVLTGCATSGQNRKSNRFEPFGSIKTNETPKALADGEKDILLWSQ